MKAKYLIIASLLLAAAQLPAQRIWTLEQCIDTALSNNRNIKQQQLSYKSKEISYSQAKANILPNLNASAGQNFNFGRSLGADNTYISSNSATSSFGISSDLTLFDGLKMKYNIDAKKAELLAAGADWQKVEKDIILNVSTVFLQVLQNKELLKNAESQLELTRNNLIQRKELIKMGKLAEGEIYELQAQEAKEELQRVQAENNLQISKLDLSQVMDLEDFQNLDVMVPANLMENELALLSAEEVYNSALLTRPELKAAQYRLQSSEKNIAIAKADYLPSLGFGAQVGTGYYNMSRLPANESFNDQISNNLSTALGFRLSIPIFNRFEVKNRVKSAKIEVENTKIEIEKTKIELRKTIQQAYYNAIAAKNRWESSQKSVRANEEAYRFASQKFESGRANQYEVNIAKNNLAQSLSEQTQAKYEYVFRMKLLELMR
ncbi:MAG TPA: TolC family protein [Paludibacteraceae bacterium]|nr:TolC family protein [Paludibacteraceae bacterium]HPT42751.1 TolC family protein [Paludibacteraceae bacterium]